MIKKQYQLSTQNKKMNELTKNLVIETALQNKAAAKRNGNDFKLKVKIAHWNHLIDVLGVDLKYRFMGKLDSIRPDLFDKEGFIDVQADFVFNLDYQISNRIKRMIERKIKTLPDLQLNYDWNDLPILTVDPNYKMELETIETIEPEKSKPLPKKEKEKPKGKQLELFI